MQLSWDLLHSLEALHGEAFYLLDLPCFERNYQAFLNAFREIYPNTQIAYSYKTNYTPRLCRLVNQFGGYAEIVSGMEYDLAERLGVEGARIIFNGPYKPSRDVRRALLSGAVVNLESCAEVGLVEEIALEHPARQLRLGMRCNFEFPGERESRFGFGVCNGALDHALSRLERLPNCRIEGLSCHFMTRERSASSYARLAESMLELASTKFPVSPPRFIDLGGGFFSNMGPELRAQFPFHVPSFAEYADAIATPFRNAYPNGCGPELILEPGLALVADAMQFVTRLIDLKEAGERRIALVSGSIYNVRPTRSRRNLPVTVYPATPSSAGEPQKSVDKPVDFVGYTCMEDDCLYTGFQGAPHPGDYVVFEHAGAYTNVLKPPFINPSPPILAYTGTPAAFEVVRRQEVSSDIFATYIF
jgi:diaminopimelate decarboxylase